MTLTTSAPRRSAVFALAAALLLFTGCGATRVGLDLAGRAPLNVNPVGESTPVTAVFYQLRDAQRFRTATVDQIWLNARDILKSDLIGEPTEAIVQAAGPADPAQRIELTLDPACTAIGVLGKFSKADARDLRTLVVPVDKADGARLEFRGYAVVLAGSATAAP